MKENVDISGSVQAIEADAEINREQQQAMDSGFPGSTGKTFREKAVGNKAQRFRAQSTNSKQF